MRGVWALELKYWGSGVRVRLGLRWWWWWWCVCGGGGGCLRTIARSCNTLLGTGLMLPEDSSIH